MMFLILLFTKLLASSPITLKQYIKTVEKSYEIPEGLLSAICYYESRNRIYAISYGKRSRYFNSPNEAANFVQTIFSKGYRNLNIGCMQINYHCHRKKFRSILEMLNPKNNIVCAAEILKYFFNRYKNWPAAVRAYNSGSAHKSYRYWHTILSIWRSRSPFIKL